MTENDFPVFLSLISFLVVFPVVAYYNKRTSLVLFFAFAVCAVVFWRRADIERYDRMDFFPWNEANLVKKRLPNSTVIDCAWHLDKNKSDNVFSMSDPVVAPYDNEPSP